MKPPLRQRLPRWPVLLIAAVAVMVALSACLTIKTDNSDANLPKEASKEFGTVFEAYQQLKAHHADKKTLDDKKLAEGAIRGMIETLDDPFSGYIPKSLQGTVREQLDGTYEGIGVEILIKDGFPVVIAPIRKSPAEKAGVRAGDIIIRIDGATVENVPEDDVITKVRGPKGTKVTLEIVRPPQPTPIAFTLTRDEIRRTTVDTDDLGDGLFRISISQFQPKTGEEFRDHLRELMQKRPAGIVLDLRNNPGGYLDVVVDVASQFLKDGLVLYDVDGDGKRTEWPVKDDGLAQRVPLVVLVNHGSASGSEVVSGALQARNRAKVVGTQTFGKGSVNQTYPLSDGSSVRLTTAKWHAPNGLQISKVGITPDIIIDKTPEDDTAGRDPQLAKALEVLKSEIEKAKTASRAPLAG